MQEKRVTLFAGHYGSGKTNIAVNYARRLSLGGRPVTLADLDIVNPYFRAKDSEQELERLGIRLISSPYANSNVDIPAIPQEMYAVIDDKSRYAVLDIGGDDRGALALGRYAPGILREHDYEMLYFTDNTDSFIPDLFGKYRDKPLRSVVDGELELDGETKPDETERYKETFDFIKETLGDKVTEVKASTKLKTHPVCLSSGEGLTFEMEKYFTAVQPDLNMKAKRILEINVDHPAFLTFETARAAEPEKAKKYAQIFYNQACLIAGLPIDDPSAYTDLLCSLWQ